MNVLVTRPEQRGRELVELLNQHGIFAVHQPLFTIEAGTELPQLPSALSRLNENDYVFAVSRHAVDYAVETLRQTGFHFRNDLHYFAVGSATASYFSAKAEQGVRYPIFSENSEGLLDLPEMQQLSEKNILVLRADFGRELFAEQAIQRGAKVQYLECYRRQLTDENLSEKMSLAKRTGVDTIIATSSEIVTTLIEQTAPDDQQWLLDCRLLVVGNRIANLAQRLGWQKDKLIIAEKADNQTLFQTLCG